MAYLVAIVAGLIGAAAGWIAGHALQPTISEYAALLPDIPAFGRGARGVDPETIGAVIGVLIPAGLALRFYGGYRTVPALAWRSLVVVTAVAAFGTATLRVGAVVFDQFGMNAGAPSVAFEIRLPAGLEPSRADVQIELQTDRNQMIASPIEIARESDHALLRGAVPILFRTTQRMIVLSLPGEPVRVFKLRLSESPSRHGDFGPWQEAELAAAAAQRPRRDAGDVAIRYRVF